MKKYILFILFFSFFFLLSNKAYATSGACSDHGGANCAIGSIDGYAVCNDGYLSSVLYGDMSECIGYNASCVTYVSGNQYVSDKASLQSQINIQLANINTLNLNLNSLGTQEEQDILNLEQKMEGSGATIAGLQPQINTIQASYVQKGLTLNQQIETATNQYNTDLQKYNSICQTYTYDEKNNICIQNLGNNYKLVGNSCVAQPVPYVVPAVSQSIQADIPASSPSELPTQSVNEIPTQELPVVKTSNVEKTNTKIVASTTSRTSIATLSLPINSNATSTIKINIPVRQFVFIKIVLWFKNWFK